MLNKYTSRVKDFILGFTLAAIMAVPIMFWNGYFRQVPYNDVEVVSISRNIDGDIYFAANFNKNDSCLFDGLTVNGESYGVWGYVDFEAIQGDIPHRFEGDNTLLLEIDGSTYMDNYQIKVRHKCIDDKGEYTNYVGTTFHEFKSSEIADYE